MPHDAPEQTPNSPQPSTNLLARQGYAALTIESVARESGVAKNHIYRR